LFPLDASIMPKAPAARINDMTAHGSPLVPGPPSKDVLIGSQLAWLGMTAAQVASLLQTFKQGMEDIAKADAAVKLATGTPGQAAAETKRLDTIKTAGENMADAMKASGASINTCPQPLPLPHGPGVVITPSQTVFINGKGACRIGDTIQEATCTNVIASGWPTVIIGG
jgi:hypothetical protein